MSAAPEVTYRPSTSRGHGDHGWLRSYHTFNFANYYSHVPREQAWGSLRVINEDRVAPKNGFPTHPHREFEIFSVVLDGVIDHRDNLGNKELLGRGDVQMTSAGTGVSHSEYNGGKGDEGLHFLQIWAKPNQSRLKPSYYTRHFSDDEKRNTLLPIVAPLSFPGVKEGRESSGPAPVHSGLTVYTSILSPNATVSHTFANEKGYLHVPMASGYRGPRDTAPPSGASLRVTVGDKTVELLEGDGLYFDKSKGAEVVFTAGGATDAEFVFFDIE